MADTERVEILSLVESLQKPLTGIDPKARSDATLQIVTFLEEASSRNENPKRTLFFSILQQKRMNVIHYFCSFVKGCAIKSLLSLV